MTYRQKEIAEKIFVTVFLTAALVGIILPLLIMATYATWYTLLHHMLELI